MSCESETGGRPECTVYFLSYCMCPRPRLFLSYFLSPFWLVLIITLMFIIICFAEYEKYRGPLGNVRKGVLVRSSNAILLHDIVSQNYLLIFTFLPNRAKYCS